jgi:hypothetical protein
LLKLEDDTVNDDPFAFPAARCGCSCGAEDLDERCNLRRSSATRPWWQRRKEVAVRGHLRKGSLGRPAYLLSTVIRLMFPPLLVFFTHASSASLRLAIEMFSSAVTGGGDNSPASFSSAWAACRDGGTSLVNEDEAGENVSLAARRSRPYVLLPRPLPRPRIVD